jgi:hypothetical protein
MGLGSMVELLVAGDTLHVPTEEPRGSRACDSYMVLYEKCTSAPSNTGHTQTSSLEHSGMTQASRQLE